jgi:hypothetical protein
MSYNELGLLRTIGYYTIGLILPFIFARMIITLLVNVFSFDGIFYKKRNRDVLQAGCFGSHVLTPINDSVHPTIRGTFGLILPWWLLKIIFGKKS